MTSPARADLVAALGETTGQPAFERMRARMAADSTGRRILAERPRVVVGDRRSIRLLSAGFDGAQF